jgi:hypothetical protein
MRLRTLICSIAAVVCFSGAANANTHALGVRLSGNNASGGVELSWLTKMFPGHRIEIGAAWNSDDYIGAGVYWHFMHQNIADKVNWYVGGGPALEHSDRIYVSARLPIGIEIDWGSRLWPPLLSVDIRPGLLLVPRIDFGWDIGIGIRFPF